MTPAEIVARLEQIREDLLSPFDGSDYIPGAIEDAAESIAALIREIEST